MPEQPDEEEQDVAGDEDDGINDPLTHTDVEAPRKPFESAPGKDE